MEPLETPVAEFTAEELAAAAKLDPVDTTEGVPEGFNDDGTPKEELILGKFKSNDDLIKAYQELEKKLGAPKETPKEEPKAAEEIPQEAKGLITPKDFDSFSEEFNKSGTLSEDTYKSLEAKGLSKDIVDAYIEGQKAVAETKANKLLQYVGGQEKYSAMVEWAKSNYSQEQAKAFDDALFSGNELKVQEQVDLLAFRMSKGGVRRIEGTSVDSGAPAFKPFESKGEWRKYTADPLYGKDAKYTKMVDTRYLKSLEVGTL